MSLCTTSHLRTVLLFGKHYWWDHASDGRLTLRRAVWMQP